MLSRLCNEYCVPHSCAQLHRSVWQCAPWPGPKYTTAWKTCFWETANKLIDGIQYHWWKKSRVLQIAKSWDWLVKCHKGCGVLFIDKRHDPLQKMCWQPTSQGDWNGTIATWLQFIATTRAFCLFTFSHISTKSKPEISNECFTSPL